MRNPAKTCLNPQSIYPGIHAMARRVALGFGLFLLAALMPPAMASASAGHSSVETAAREAVRRDAPSSTPSICHATPPSGGERPIWPALALALALLIIALMAYWNRKLSRAKARLQYSQRHYQSLVDAMSEGVITHDERGEIITCNPAAAAMLGIHCDQILGTCSTDPQWRAIREDGSPWPGDDHPAMVTLRSGQPQRDALMGLYAPDESLRWLQVNTAPIYRNGDARPDSVVATFTDVSAKREVDRQLQETDAYLHSVLASMDDLVFVLDSEGRFLDSHQGDHDRLYQPREAFTGKHYREVLPADVGERLSQALADARQGSSTRFEYALPMPEGKHWYNAVVSARHDAEARYLGCTVVVRDINARKQAERQLFRNEERYRRLVSTMAEGVIMQDRDGRITECNRAAERILGLSREQLMGLTSMDPRWRAIRQDGTPYPGEEHPLPTALRTGQPQTDIIHGIHTGKGQLRWIKVNAIPLFSRKTDRPDAVATFTDITELLDSQRQLQRERRLLQTMIDNLPVAIEIFSPEGKVVLANPVAREILSVDDDADLTVPLEELNHCFQAYIEDTNQPYPTERMPVVNALLGKTSMVEDMELRRADGARRLLQVIAAPLEDPEASYGETSGCVVVFQDISERKRTEGRLRMEQARLQALLQINRNAAKMSEEEIFRAGLEDAERLTNSRVAYLHFINEDQENIDLGYWSGKVMQHCAVATEHHYPLSQAGIWADAARQRRLIVHNDYAAVQAKQGLPEGHVPLTRHMGAPVLEGGKVRMVIGVGDKPSDYDEADQRQLELIAEELWRIVSRRRTEIALDRAREAAEAANHAKSAFLANMSHELRTPLNAILGFSQVLLQSPGIDADAREQVQKIRRGGDYLLTLINDILDLSKIEAGRIELFPEEIPLAGFLSDATQMLQYRAEQKGVRFHYQPAPDLPSVIRTDPKRLRQVLLNLLGNAVKFTEQGQIILRIDYRDGILRLEVEDSGPGIAEDQLERIFQPFEQTGASHYQSEGTGLGLAITRRIAERMGGTVSVRSEAGKGSCFILEAPMEAGFRQPARPSSEAHAQAPREITGYRVTALEQETPLRLMVVDDIADNRQLLAHLLSRYGFRVAEAESGEACLAQAPEFRPHLVLMDMRMPGRDGLETMHALHQMAGMEELPVIIVSASVFHEDRDAALAKGVADYINKPVELPELAQALARQLPLEWVYAAQSCPSGEQSAASEDAEADYPLAWLEALKAALTLGDTRGLRQLLANREAQGEIVPQTLRDWLDGYQYERILEWIEQHRHET